MQYQINNYENSLEMVIQWAQLFCTKLMKSFGKENFSHSLTSQVTKTARIDTIT